MPKPSRLLAAALLVLPALMYSATVLFSDSRAVVLWERGAPEFSALPPLLAGLLAWAGIVVVLTPRLAHVTRRRVVAGCIALAFAAGLLLQTAATRVVDPFPLRSLLLRQFSDFTGGYWSVGARVMDAPAWLDNFAQEMESYNVHAERHPPGLPLIFYFTRLPFDALPELAASIAAWARPLACFDDGGTTLSNAAIAGGVLGALLETLAAWAVLPLLYVFVRRTISQHTALIAVLLYPLTSGMLIWVSQWDRTFGLLAVGALLLTDRLLPPRKDKTPFGEAVALGLLLALGTLFSFGNTPLIMICGLYALARLSRRRAEAPFVTLLVSPREVALLLTAAAGFVAPWLLLIAGFGFDLPATYATAMRFHLELERPFWPFVLWHAWDIFTFIGLPLVAAALLAWRRWPALALAAFGTLATLCLLHVARGETGRVWMFFAPLITALAAAFLTPRKSNASQENSNRFTAARVVIPLIVGALALQSLVQIGWLRVIGYGVDPLTQADAAAPPNLSPTEIRFERNGELQLLGVAMPDALAPGDYASIDLLWKLDAAAPVATSYKVFVHVADSPEDQRRIVNQDGRPMSNALPFTCWRPNQIVLDRHAIRIDENAAPGVYAVIVGLYDERSGTRAFVHTAQVAVANGVTLPQRLTVSD
jgi:hypothetical protein